MTRSGAIWRWDGYTIRAGTPTAAAVRLQQRNRLAGLRTRLAAAEQAAASARADRASAETAAQASVAAEQQARNARREWEQKLERARGGLTQLRNQAATATARLAAADDQLARITGERDEATEALARVREAQTALPDVAALRAAWKPPVRRCRRHGREKRRRGRNAIRWRGSTKPGSTGGG